MPTTPESYTEIGSFEAKTRLSELLRKAKAGERFTITKRGQAQAHLVPVREPDRRSIEEAVRDLQAMPKIEGVPSETVRAWIEEGRE